MRAADLIRDRKLWLLLLCSLLSVVVGFFSVKGMDAILWVSNAGYWFVLCAFLIWVYALWECYGDKVKALTFKGLNYKMGAFVAACGTVLISHEGFGFKILMDEVMLLSTSMNMHFDRLAVVAERGNDVNGSFVLLGRILDKRPLFHPFLLSLVHDITGYRPENALILNGILVFVFLFLVAKLGRLFAGTVGAVVGVLLFTGLPLLGQNACGGGFELLNLVMAVALILLAVRWVEKRDEASLTAMCFAAILLVQIRYESVLLAAPVVLAVLWVWLQERRLILDWRVAVSPLLLIMYALHNQVFSMKADAYQLLSKPGYEKPFSLAYIPENIVHAVAFYFGKPSDQPNSILFSLIGWLLMPLATLVLFRWLKALKSQTSERVVIVFFFCGFALHFLLLMAYFWGQLDDMVIRRLSLPSHLWLLIVVLVVFSQWPKVQKLYWALCAVAAGFALIVAVPSMASHSYFQLYTPTREVAWRRDFIKKSPAPDFLVIDNDSSLWITHKVSSTTVGLAKKNIDSIAYHIKNHSFSGVYVYQHIEINETTGAATVRPDDDLGPDYELVPVCEERFNVLHISRMSRVVSVRASTGVQKAQELLIGDHQFKNSAEAERIRYQYLENFIKQLP